MKNRMTLNKIIWLVQISHKFFFCICNCFFQSWFIIKQQTLPKIRMKLITSFFSSFSLFSAINFVFVSSNSKINNFLMNFSIFVRINHFESVFSSMVIMILRNLFRLSKADKFVGFIPFSSFFIVGKQSHIFQI